MIEATSVLGNVEDVSRCAQRVIRVKCQFDGVTPE